MLTFITALHTLKLGIQKLLLMLSGLHLDSAQKSYIGKCFFVNSEDGNENRRETMALKKQHKNPTSHEGCVFHGVFLNSTCLQVLQLIPLVKLFSGLPLKLHYQRDTFM